jgi:hypothetical protein
MALGRHHQHLRKRLYKNLEPYPHPKFWVRFLDRIIFVVGFLGPAFTIPQLWLIYVDHVAAGVSVLSWSAYAAFNIVWIAYGLVHKERAITFTYSLWFVVNTLVAIGALLY